MVVKNNMPYSKDIRVGQGWFEVNVNCFYEYLNGIDEELIVKEDFCPSEVAYHTKHLEEQIESRVNEYISWRVFGEQREKIDSDDWLPKEFEEDIWGYVYHQICTYVVWKKPSWYELRSTLDSDDDDEEDSPKIDDPPSPKTGSPTA